MVINRLYYFYILLISVFLFSCHRHENTASILKQAEEVMEAHPDSALILLTSITISNKMPKSEKALYALLYTQACDKNYITHTSDSLIRIAINYYDNKNDEYRKAQSYFYLGSVYRDMGDSIRAIDAFLKAKESITPGTLNRLSGLINYNLTQQFTEHGFYNKAKQIARENYFMHSLRNDSADMVFPLQDLGRLYVLENKEDSALIYFLNALNICRKKNIQSELATTLSDIAMTYYYKKDYLLADKYVNEAILYARNTYDSLSIYSRKGDILSFLGKYDSARYYLMQSIQSTDLKISASSADALYELEKKLGNHEQAIVYNDLYITLYDSISIQQKREEVSQSIRNHEQNNHTRKMAFKWEKDNYIWICLLIVLIFIFCGVILIMHKKKKGEKEEKVKNNSNGTTDILLTLNNKAAVFIEKDTYKQMNQVEVTLTSTTLNLNSNERIEIHQSIITYFGDEMSWLRKKYYLTQDDTYCCILIYLGFTNRAISTFMGCSLDALKSRKKRLRKKLDTNMIERLAL